MVITKSVNFYVYGIQYITIIFVVVYILRCVSLVVSIRLLLKQWKPREVIWNGGARREPPDLVKLQLLL